MGPAFFLLSMRGIRNQDGISLLVMCVCVGKYHAREYQQAQPFNAMNDAMNAFGGIEGYRVLIVPPILFSGGRRLRCLEVCSLPLADI